MIAKDKEKIQKTARQKWQGQESPSETMLTADVASETMEVGGSGMTSSEE